MGQKNNNISVVSLDWLQFSVMNHKRTLINKNWVKQDFKTRLFSDIYYFIEDNKTYFELVMHPKSIIINENLAIIKVNNEFLYNPLVFECINELMKEEKFIFNNITRLDICLDFERFHNELHPQEFIHNFLNDKYLKNNVQQYKVIGTQTYCNNYEYIRFGTGNSAVSFYLYNKSKEFRDVKLKSYISEKWKKCGINTFLDVWRLEFSIKEFNKILIDKSTGLYYNIDLMYLATQSNWFELFTALYNKYFDFRVNDGKSNKSRMRRIEFFKLEQFNTCWYVNNQSSDSDKSDKIMIKKLNAVQNEIRAYNEERADEIEELQLYLIRKKNLEKWAKQRNLLPNDEAIKYSNYYKENEGGSINSLYNL